MTHDRTTPTSAAATHLDADMAAVAAEIAKLASLERRAPKPLAAFARFEAAAMAEGALPRRTKELIAVAVALTTQCPYCLKVHSELAREAGASEAELAEAAFVAAALRAGAGVMHAADLVVRG